MSTAERQLEDLEDGEKSVVASQPPQEVIEKLARDFNYEIGIDPLSLRYAEINALYNAQARKTYDGIEDLAESIDESDLYHPLMVAELDILDAIEYVNGLNKMWGTLLSVNELTPNSNGKYYILIAGHRRKKASDLYLDKVSRVLPDFDINKVNIKCIIHANITLEEALKHQIAENTHRSVPPHEDAYSIQMYYNQKSKEGEFTVAQCARELGKSEEKVRLAIRFCELPLAVRQVVEEGFLSYGAALELHPYATVLREKEQILGELGQREIEQKVEDLLMSFIGMAHKEGWRINRIKEVIRGIVADLKMGQMELELAIEDLSTRTRSAARRYEAAVALSRVALTQMNVALEHVDPLAAGDPRVTDLVAQLEVRLEQLKNPQPRKNYTEEGLF